MQWSILPHLLLLHSYFFLQRAFQLGLKTLSRPTENVNIFSSKPCFDATSNVLYKKLMDTNVFLYKFCTFIWRIGPTPSHFTILVEKELTSFCLIFFSIHPQRAPSSKQYGRVSMVDTSKNFISFYSQVPSFAMKWLSIRSLRTFLVLIIERKKLDSVVLFTRVFAEILSPFIWICLHRKLRTRFFRNSMDSSWNSS